jgi:hypothetical protein
MVFLAEAQKRVLPGKGKILKIARFTPVDE